MNKIITLAAVVVLLFLILAGCVGYVGLAIMIIPMDTVTILMSLTPTATMITAMLIMVVIKAMTLTETTDDS